MILSRICSFYIISNHFPVSHHIFYNAITVLNRANFTAQFRGANCSTRVPAFRAGLWLVMMGDCSQRFGLQLDLALQQSGTVPGHFKGVVGSCFVALWLLSVYE